MKTEPILNFIKSNPAVALTMLTGASYFFAFRFESGVCEYYQIPTALIEIGVSNLLTITSICFISMIFLYYLSAVVWGILKVSERELVITMYLRGNICFFVWLFYFWMQFDGQTAPFSFTI